MVVTVLNLRSDESYTLVLVMPISFQFGDSVLFRTLL